MINKQYLPPPSVLLLGHPRNGRRPCIDHHGSEVGKPQPPGGQVACQRREQVASVKRGTDLGQPVPSQDVFRDPPHPGPLLLGYVPEQAIIRR